MFLQAYTLLQVKSNLMGPKVWTKANTVVCHFCERFILLGALDRAQNAVSNHLNVLCLAS